jgi:hypothetical protein
MQITGTNTRVISLAGVIIFAHPWIPAFAGMGRNKWLESAMNLYRFTNQR